MTSSDQWNILHLFWDKYWVIIQRNRSVCADMEILAKIYILNKNKGKHTQHIHTNGQVSR